MTDTRALLIEALRKTLATGVFTNDELEATGVDARTLIDAERLAWQRLSHWADDDDIRTAKPSYEAIQRSNLTEALRILESGQNA